MRLLASFYNLLTLNCFTHNEHFKYLILENKCIYLSFIFCPVWNQNLSKVAKCSIIIRIIRLSDEVMFQCICWITFTTFNWLNQLLPPEGNWKQLFSLCRLFSNLLEKWWIIWSFWASNFYLTETMWDNQRKISLCSDQTSHSYWLETNV